MTGPSHREPLDEHERELARVLRALPAGEPPAALDQRILRAAADAAAAPRRRHRHWLAIGGTGWGIGGAAAAVLALGVSWHLIDPTRNAPFERSSAPTFAEQSGDAVTVTLPEPKDVESDASVVQEVAPAPAAEQERRSQSRPAPARARAGKPSSAAPLAATVAPPVVAAPQAPPPPPSEPFADLAGTASDATGTWAPEPAPAAVQAEAQRSAEARADRAEGAREAADAAIPLHSPAAASGELAKARADSMTPAAWFAQVRSLRDAQRHAEAADSLRRFRRAYPQYPVPADLLPLLRE